MLLEAVAKGLGTIPHSIGPIGHADLGKDSPQSTLMCDPPDGESAPRAL
jgi:hypothetical protein